MLEFKRSSGGAVAQLGARLDGIEEVVGSNPIGSTKIRNAILGVHSPQPIDYALLHRANSRCRESPGLPQRELFKISEK